MNRYDALRTINKKAKQYMDSIEKRDKCRGRALYKLKYRAINTWVDDFDRVEKHMIDSEPFYCFYKSEYSFHIPEEKVFGTVNPKKTVDMGNFESSRVQDLSCSEKRALELFEEEYSMNANGFLPSDAPIESNWGFLQSFNTGCFS